jgi:hypothetical protein
MHFVFAIFALFLSYASWQTADAYRVYYHGKTGYHPWPHKRVGYWFWRMGSVLAGIYAAYPLHLVYTKSDTAFTEVVVAATMVLGVILAGINYLFWVSTCYCAQKGRLCWRHEDCEWCSEQHA